MRPQYVAPVDCRSFPSDLHPPLPAACTYTTNVGRLTLCCPALAICDIAPTLQVSENKRQKVTDALAKYVFKVPSDKVRLRLGHGESR